MKVSKRKDYVRQSFDQYSACQGRSLRNPNLIAIEKWYLISVCRGYSSSFIPFYELLIKCEVIVKATHADKKQIDV